MKGSPFTTSISCSAVGSYAGTGNPILSVKPPRIGIPPDGRAYARPDRLPSPADSAAQSFLPPCTNCAAEGNTGTQRRVRREGVQGEGGFDCGSNQFSASPGRLLWFLSCRSKKGTPPAGMTSETRAEAEPKPNKPPAGIPASSFPKAKTKTHHKGGIYARKQTHTHPPAADGAGSF